MDNDFRNKSTKGFWWKRFYYSATGATGDYELGPNWFASVMGTGIIANAAVSLPLFSDKLHSFALIVWCLAAFMLIGFVLATLPLSRHRQNVWKKNISDPMMAQLANHTGLPLFQWASIFYYTGLLTAWAVAAFGTTKGMIKGHLFRPPPSPAAPIVSVKEPFNPDNKENGI